MLQSRAPSITFVSREAQTMQWDRFHENTRLKGCFLEFMSEAKGLEKY